MSALATLAVASQAALVASPAPLVASASPMAASPAAATQAALAASPAAALQAPAADTLRAPPVLQDRHPSPDTVEVVLAARPARLSLLPGKETDLYTYGGTFPGPTLDVDEGDHVIVRFRNELPEATTIHWHGLHLPFDADGSPFHPVPPGGEYTYAFTVPVGTAGTYWYHPHPMHDTTWQIGKGLLGAVIVRAEDDPLPDMTERLLILSDNRFHEDGSLSFPEPGTRQARIDEQNGREGDALFVNGQIEPVIPIAPGEVQRWRVINASGARVYRVAVPGHTLIHVGSDGGLFEIPVEREDILLANTERAEVLVRGVGESGSEVAVEDRPYDRYRPLTRPRDWDRTRTLATLRYGTEPGQGVETPDRLREVPALREEDASAVRVLRLDQGRINGQTMDMGRVDLRAELGATEVWEIRNLVGMDHPFHLHGFRFQVLSRNGEPAPYRSWKDTVNVPARETVRFIVRFDDYPGKWMFHCHIVDHEDMGMMGVLEVG
ncbi:MAG TPA: multicopper oxidase family protein [Longimicrobiales bacterium]|nr:multicopper oxidase family protein [Longimicrobiales bacterium]